MHRTVFSASILALLFPLSLLPPHMQVERKLSPTVTGEVIDAKCYLTLGPDQGRGEAHKECAIACAKGGVPLAILEDKTGKVIFAARARGAAGANEMLLPFVADRVVVTGRMVERGGARMVLVETIERAAIR